MLKKLLLYFPILLACFLSSQAISAQRVTIKINPDGGGSKVAVGDIFYIEIEATNCNGSLTLPGGSSAIPGAKFLYKSESQSQSISISGASANRLQQTTLTLTCRAETPGKYSYGPVTVGATRSNVASYEIVSAGTRIPDNDPYQSQPQSQPSRPSSMPQNYDPNGGPVFVGKGNEEMFMRANVNKTKVYEQEAIVYTVKLYSTYQYIKFLGATESPKFDGFVVEETKDLNPSWSVEDFQGKRYYTATIIKYIIFPQKPGRLKITGNTYTVSTDAMSYYHDPFFSTMQVKRPIQLNVTPNDLEIDVMGLPQPVPAEFIGAVGSFSLSAQMPKQQLFTNTPASIIYTLTGTGNIKYVKMPELNDIFPSNIEVYSPEVTVDANVGASNVSGTAKFDYSILPMQTGNFQIPALKVAYFDPVEGVYKTLEAQGFNITVGQGTSSDKSQQAARFVSALLPVSSLSREVATPYVYTFLFWLWFIIPVAIFISSLFFYRKYIRDHQDLALLKSKRANKMALKRLKKAYACIRANKEEQFYDEMLAALWGYLGDKLKMPTSELSRSNVSEVFKEHGMDEATFMPVINIIDECEFAKYAPSSRHADMTSLYQRALEALEKVDNEYVSLSKNAVNPKKDESDDEV